MALMTPFDRRAVTGPPWARCRETWRVAGVRSDSNRGLFCIRCGTSPVPIGNADVGEQTANSQVCGELPVECIFPLGRAANDVSVSKSKCSRQGRQMFVFVPEFRLHYATRSLHFRWKTARREGSTRWMIEPSFLCSPVFE